MGPGAPDVVGFVGLGLMGSAMSANVLDAGFDVVGFDVDEERVAAFASRGGRPDSLAGVAAECPVIVLSLPNSDVVRSVCLGPGSLAAGAAAGTLVIDTTTGRPADTEEIGAALEAAGIRYVDATLSGNSAMAARRDLVAMVGGSHQDVAAARPVLEAMTRSIHHLGPVGSGSRTKLVVNLVVGVHRLVLAEGLVMGEKSGLDLGVLLAVLKDSAASSKAMDLWGDRMVTGDHFPPDSRVRQSHKDFRLIVEQGESVAAPTWLASTVRRTLEIAEADGLADADNSAVAEVLRRAAGIGRVPRNGAG